MNFRLADDTVAYAEEEEADGIVTVTALIQPAQST